MPPEKKPIFSSDTDLEADSLFAAKKSARTQAKARLAAVSQCEFAQMGLAVCRRLTGLEIWQQAPAVFCFVSMPAEMDTLPLLQAALADEKLLFVPRMKPGGQMDAVSITDLAALRPNRYGILEPESGETATPAELSEAGALAILPCLATGRDGTRLGRGGGYYDRFLAQFTGPSVVVCPENLLFDTLPTGPLDARPGAILTENAFYAYDIDRFCGEN